MEYCKETACPFLSKIKLEEGGSTTFVDRTHYIHLIGSLLYLTYSRRDISYVVSAAIRYIQMQPLVVSTIPLDLSFIATFTCLIFPSPSLLRVMLAIMELVVFSLNMNIPLCPRENPFLVRIICLYI